MKIDVKKIEKLSFEEKKVLKKYRKIKSFDVRKYLEEKEALLIKYCLEFKIDSLVVLVSGGIDSAVVAGIADSVSRKANLKLHLVTLPAYGTDGVSGQAITVDLSQKLAMSLSRSLKVIPLQNTILNAFEASEVSTKWGRGQSVSYIRTAMAYSYVTSLWEKGERAVILGTTNLDEGAYIGYVGKASDGMVDLQIISDIHKSEVYQVGELLKVPEAIMKNTPTGDMYHKAVDEEIFGCKYDHIELYFAVKAGIIEEPLGENWKNVVKNIEDLRAYNKHKYLSASPAIHINVLDVDLAEGGWNFEQYK